MRSGQFYKGMINDVEATYESPDLLQLLPSDKLNILWDREKLGLHRRVFLSDRVITLTLIAPAVPDEHGRDGIINHTIIYKFDSYTTHDGAKYIFDREQFEQDIRLGKYDLKMPPAPELKRPLDPPPILEELL